MANHKPDHGHRGTAPPEPGAADSEVSPPQSLASLRTRLQAAEDILRAIRQGEIDALAIHSQRGPQIHTLSGAEHPYRILVETMNEGAVTLTADGKILYGNPAFSRLVGIEQELPAHSEMQRFIEPEDQPLLEALLKRGIKEHSKGELRLRVNGVTVPVLLSLSALNLNELPCACLVVTDLREQKRNHAVLASEQLTNSILDQAAEAIIVCDPAGLVTRANQKAQSLCGFNPLLAVFDEAFPLYLPLPGFDGQGISAGTPMTIAAVLGGRAYDRLEVGLQFNGQPTGRSMLLSAVPLRSAANQILGCVVNLIDITDRKEAEHAQAELLRREQQARDEAQAANQAKDVFLATLSHELRTPLSAVLGWVSLLRKNPIPSIVEKATAIIERNALIQAQLIDDILDISRIVSGKIALGMSIVNLTEVTNAAVESVRLSAEAKGLTLRTTLGDDTPLVLGDAGRLQQVLWNLLSNATKFTPQGGLIEVRLDGNQHHLVVSVSDTGRGIEADFLPYVFDRFRQADGSTTRMQGGLGLGLAIVRYLVEAHGGTVTVASPGEGRGSTFSVQLPRAAHRGVDVAPPAGGTAATAQMSSATKAEPSAELLTGLRVLIVDDQSDTLSFLAMALQWQGAQVSTADSAAAALKLLEQESFDVLISDIAMPGTDGYQLLAELRARETARQVNPGIPAIAVTAFARTTEVQEALHAGFQRHITKPVNVAELVAAVAALGRGHQQPLGS